jgi:hypothetical protein
VKSSAVHVLAAGVFIMGGLGFSMDNAPQKDAAAEQVKSVVRIGAMNLDMTGMDAASMATANDALSQALSELGFYKVYGQTELAQGFEGIKQRLPAHCRDPRCIAGIGSALGLDKMVYGQLDRNASTYGISLVLLDVQKRLVDTRVTFEGEPGTAPADLIKAAVTQLHGLTQEKDRSRTRPYFGPEIHNEKLGIISGLAWLGAGLIWAGANGTLKDLSRGGHSDQIDTLTMSGFVSSSLHIPLFARPAALADGYVAASDDAYGVLYNPAGMAWVPHQDIAVGYQYRYDCLNNFVAAYANKMTREIGFGHAVYYNGDYEHLQSELYFLTAWAYKFNRLLPFMRPLSLGLSMKLINKTTPQTDQGTVSQKTFGLGFDIGVLTELADHIRFGFVFRDVPTFEKVNNDRFQYTEYYPSILQAGGTYQAGYSTFLICEGQVPLNADQAWKFAGGIEQEFFQIIKGRVGLKKEVSFDAPWLITAGFGARFGAESDGGSYVVLDGAYEYNTIGLFPVANVSFRIGL